MVEVRVAEQGDLGAVVDRLAVDVQYQGGRWRRCGNDGSGWLDSVSESAFQECNATGDVHGVVARTGCSATRLVHRAHRVSCTLEVCSTPWLSVYVDTLCRIRYN